MENKERNGIVTSIKLSHNPTYNILSDKVLQIKSNLQLELGEEVVIKEEAIESIVMDPKKTQDYKKTITKFLDEAQFGENIKKIILDERYSEVAQKLTPDLKKAAELLVKGFVSGAPIVVRFHNDGDGSAGGIALFRAFASLQEKFFTGERNVSWQMNKSIAYSLESYYTDKMLFDSFKSIERPIVVITDFGTTTESVEAIKESQGNCNLIWLDHHIPYDEFPREMITNYINVCDYGGESSFTAGLLTCIFAQVLSNVNVEDIKAAALVSDYSKYADYKNEDALKKSLILDYLTSSSNEMYGKPKQMDLILTNSEKSQSTFHIAEGLLSQAIDTGIKNLTIYKNGDGINICVLDFGHIARLRLDYPLPGRYSSKLQDNLESKNNGKTLTVVYYGSYISLRSSADIQSTINILSIIEKLKNATNGAVSGGGHKQAASIRTDREHIQEVLSLLLKELGVGQ
jgi:RecJ-like exonuclease